MPSIERSIILRSILGMTCSEIHTVILEASVQLMIRSLVILNMPSMECSIVIIKFISTMKTVIIICNNTSE